MSSTSELWWESYSDDSIVVAFTDARSDLGNMSREGEGVVRSPLEQQHYLQDLLGPHVHDASVVHMNQVHGIDVVIANPDTTPTADALIIDRIGVAAVVRVADCVPIVIAAPGQQLAAVVHAGRVGMAARIVQQVCSELRARGAQDLTAWVGPRACGSCYEVPAEMRAEVAAAEPAAFSETSWGTPALDVGAAVVDQLTREDVEVHDLGTGTCTIEDERFWSYRRQGKQAGRFGAVVALRPRQVA